MDLKGEITLYDIPSANSKKAWSFNTWKTRFVLNFKKLPYKTIWLEYPDIKPTLAAINMPKMGKSGTFQGVPAISDAINRSDSPTLLADSWIIAQYLEQKYPGPTSLFPHETAPLQKVMIDHISNELAFSLADLMTLRSWGHLNPESQPYFRETREESPDDTDHQTLEALCPKGPDLEAIVEKLRAAFDRLDATFAHTRGKESEGIFTLPSQMVYSDFALAGILIWMKLLANEDLWVHVSRWNDGRWSKLLNGLEERYGQVV